MLTTHSTFANYQEHTDAVNRILIDMKAQLDKYRESPTANPAAVAIREKNLVTLIKYMEASSEIIQSLADARNNAYGEGIERGRELAKEESKHQLSAHWSNKRNFPSPQDKESYRWEQNARSYSRWADHY